MVVLTRVDGLVDNAAGLTLGGIRGEGLGVTNRKFGARHRFRDGRAYQGQVCPSKEGQYDCGCGTVRGVLLTIVDALRASVPGALLIVGILGSSIN